MHTHPSRSALILLLSTFIAVTALTPTYAVIQRLALPIHLADPLLTTYILLWGSIREPFLMKMLGDDEYLFSYTKGFSELPSPAQVRRVFFAVWGFVRIGRSRCWPRSWCCSTHTRILRCCVILTCCSHLRFGGAACTSRTCRLISPRSESRFPVLITH